MPTYLSPEVLIIGAIIVNRDIRSALKEGLTPAHFAMRREQKAYETLVRYADENGGNVPSIEMFLRLSGYEDYVDPPENLSVSALAKDIMRLAKARRIQEILPDPKALEQDPDKVLADLVVKGREILAETGTLSLTPFQGAAREYEQALSADAVKPGLLFPWKSLNEPSMGLNSGEWCIYYGRPGSMKTWVLLAILANWAQMYIGRTFLFWSCELPRKTIERRLLSLLLKIPYSAIKRGNLNDGEKTSLRLLAGALEGAITGVLANIIIAKPKDLSIGALVQAVEMVKPDALLIDTAGKLRMSPDDIDSRDPKAMAKLSSSIQRIAEDNGIPIVGAFHANRTKQESVVGATGGGDIAYADALAQDADFLCRLYPLVMEDDTTKLLHAFTKTREFQFGGLLTEAPPEGTYDELMAFTTSTAVEYELTKAANRGKTSTKASEKGLNRYADRGKETKKDGSG